MPPEPTEPPLLDWPGTSSPIVLLYQIGQGQARRQLLQRFGATDDDLDRVLKARLTEHHGRLLRLTAAGEAYLAYWHDVDAAGDVEDW